MTERRVGSHWGVLDLEERLGFKLDGGTYVVHWPVPFLQAIVDRLEHLEKQMRDKL